MTNAQPNPQNSDARKANIGKMLQAGELRQIGDVSPIEIERQGSKSLLKIDEPIVRIRGHQHLPYCQIVYPVWDNHSLTWGHPRKHKPTCFDAKAYYINPTKVLQVGSGNDTVLLGVEHARLRDLLQETKSLGYSVIQEGVILSFYKDGTEIDQEKTLDSMIQNYVCAQVPEEVKAASPSKVLVSSLKVDKAGIICDSLAELKSLLRCFCERSLPQRIEAEHTVVSLMGQDNGEKAEAFAAKAISTLPKALQRIREAMGHTGTWVDDILAEIDRDLEFLREQDPEKPIRTTIHGPNDFGVLHESHVRIKEIGDKWILEISKPHSGHREGVEFADRIEKPTTLDNIRLEYVLGQSFPGWTCIDLSQVFEGLDINPVEIAKVAAEDSPYCLNEIVDIAGANFRVSTWSIRLEAEKDKEYNNSKWRTDGTKVYGYAAKASVRIDVSPVDKDQLLTDEQLHGAKLLAAKIHKNFLNAHPEVKKA
ncbi:MAG: hypothetical protein R3A13_11470 [Bdellovibrionota bacterium]